MLFVPQLSPGCFTYLEGERTRGCGLEGVTGAARYVPRVCVGEGGSRSQPHGLPQISTNGLKERDEGGREPPGVEA